MQVRWWALARGLLGAFLAVHFAALIPWGAELFSSAGIVPDGSSSPLLRLFPNVLALCDAPAAVVALLVVGTLAGATLAAGVADRPAALVAWYVLACLLGRDPLISNPSLPQLGWTLLAIAAIPAAPPLARLIRDRTAGADWELPRPVLHAAWIVAAAAYSYSGWTKLASPSWLDGTALAHVLSNPLARDTAGRVAALGHPDLLSLASYGALALELLALPLALSRRARPVLWVALLLLHLGLLAFVDFADLTLGLLVTHAFLFDPRWLNRERPPDRIVVPNGRPAPAR